MEPSPADWSAPAATRRPPARRWPGLLLLVALGVLLGAAALVWSMRRFDWVAAWVRPPEAAPVRVVRMPVAVPVATPAGSAPDPALARQVDAIDAKLDVVDARARSADAGANRAEELLVAFAARRAIERGVELGYLEGLLREHFGTRDAAAVATVLSAARRPVTLAQLRTGLAQAETTLVQGDTAESGWAAVRRELSNLLVVRRAGTDSTAPLDRYHRATLALESGEVDRALIEVARLPGRASVGNWIADARRYVAVRNALDRLETAALVAQPGTAAGL